MKTVTATEAKNRLGALMNDVLESNEPVVVELRGRPKIALVTIDQLREFEELAREERHRRALAAFDALTARIAARGNGLPEDEAMELAVEIVREIRADRAAGRQRLASGAETHV